MSLSALRSRWRPGALSEKIVAAAKRLAEYEQPIPQLDFYETLGRRAERLLEDALSTAIDVGSDDERSVLLNVEIARRLFERAGDDVFLATEAAEDLTIARLAAYLVVEGSDGYQAISFTCAWNAQRDPDWGTVWAVRTTVRDFTPAFLFKVCMRGDTRLLAVECHAPKRRMSDDLHKRLRARTMIVSGVPVVAFAPDEIEVDSGICVEDINAALSVLAQELLSLHGISDPPREENDFRPRDWRSAEL